MTNELRQILIRLPIGILLTVIIIVGVILLAKYWRGSDD